MLNEQKIRVVLFYLCVAIFFAGLPMILSYSLGYKFDTRTFKFTKTGIISLRTQPPGADIYLDGKLLKEKTPATLAELLPGKYNLRLEMERHYPWFIQANVEPRKVTRFERVILFSNRPNIKQLNQDKVSGFWVDKEGGRIYYFNRDENILYRSNMEGDRFEEIGSLPDGFFLVPHELKISPDRQKMLVFNSTQISVISLKAQGEQGNFAAPVTLNFPAKRIHNVFWHSDSYHLILVTDNNIEVLESEIRATPVSLVSLNKRLGGVFYDTDRDALYFMDSQTGDDGLTYNNAYKLELNNREYLLNDIIRLKQNEQ